MRTHSTHVYSARHHSNGCFSTNTVYRDDSGDFQPGVTWRQSAHWAWQLNSALHNNVINVSPWQVHIIKNGPFRDVQVKPVLENFCTNEGQLKPISTTGANKGKVHKWFTERFPSFNYCKPSKGFYGCWPFSVGENLELGKHVCFSYYCNIYYWHLQ